MHKGRSVNYFLTDHLGNTNGLTDANGNLTSQAAYDSFGNQSGDLATRYGFTGRERDDFTGLMYYRARWYDPKIGRFISEDPIGLAGGTNQYSYVSNNPQNATDPFGLYEIDVHYYLTKYLAQKTGCFSDMQSTAIANGNQLTDELDRYLPARGRTYTNAEYHALHEGAAPGQASPYLRMMAAYPSLDFQALGRSLHYLQDTFSHANQRHHPNRDPCWISSSFSAMDSSCAFCFGG